VKPSFWKATACVSRGFVEVFVIRIELDDFAGSAGAKTRALVLFSLKEQPKNAQQLSQSLHLDYTTVRHHLRVLETNKVVLAEGDKYGRIYFVSEVMESHWTTLEGILKRTKGKAKG